MCRHTLIEGKEPLLLGDGDIISTECMRWKGDVETFICLSGTISITRCPKRLFNSFEASVNLSRVSQTEIEVA